MLKQVERRQGHGMSRAEMRFELQTLTDYSDDAIIAELRRVAAELGGQRLTIERFDSRARVHSTTVRRRFGSWSVALDRAGIDESVAPRPKKLTRDEVLGAIKQFVVEHPSTTPTRDTIAAELDVDHNSITRRLGPWESLSSEAGLNPVPRAVGRRYTDEECFENILGLWTHYGRQPHFAELNRPPSTVGSKAYVLRWGGWRRALAAFIARVNEPAAELPPEQREPVTNSQADAPCPSGAPRSISLSLRYKVLLRDKFRCVACGRSPAKDADVELHVDHIIPWSRGGQNTESNLRTLCFDCNLGKGARSEE
ncbi:MAG: HNH endonuclease [Thermoguttaceae bacterium]|jgi:hypothetical protein